MQGTAEKFIDANVLVYAFDSSEPKKKAVAEGILKECFKGKECFAVSTQVLSEFFVAVTCKIQKPLDSETAGRIVKNFLKFKRIKTLAVKPSTLAAAVNANATTKAHFWDCLIAETMKENNVLKIITENQKDFEKMQGIIVVNPFKK